MGEGGCEQSHLIIGFPSETCSNHARSHLLDPLSDWMEGGLVS